MTAGRSRSPWPYVAGAVMVVAVGVFVFSQLTEPDLIPVNPSHSEVTIAGEVDIEPAEPLAGRPATVRATLSADRAITLTALTVKVRDEAGAYHDFPALPDVELGTAPREVELHREFARGGNYTYYLAYRLDGDWVSLPPWQHVTVR